MKNVISLREVVDCDAFLKEKCLNSGFICGMRAETVLLD